MSEAMTAVPDCIAAARIDMATGQVLAACIADPLPPHLRDLSEAAAADLFQGPAVTAVEDGVQALRGTTRADDRRCGEVLVIGPSLLRLFIRLRQEPAQALALVCPREANVGLVLAKARMLADLVAPLP